MSPDDVLAALPPVRGKLAPQAALSDVTWLRVGGPADVLFLPADEEDLAAFLKATPVEIPVTPIGVGSNLLVRDGGIPGVVVRLAGPFSKIAPDGPRRLRAGAGALDAAVSKAALAESLTGFEFLSGVPGSIGGALRMNAGAYGGETAGIFVEARALDRAGAPAVLSKSDMGFSYRSSTASADLIYVEAVFEGEPGDPQIIGARMEDIKVSREATQPIRERTGGSTFKNPDPALSGGRKAWQLIDAVGGRGRSIGDAQFSDQHCNFLINRGAATAADLEALGEAVRADVLSQEGVELNWEIKRLGRV